MRLLRDREYLPELLKEIKKAHREVIARIFLIDPAREGKQPVLDILRSLARAQKRGVEVRLLTDGIFRTKPQGRRLKEALGKFGLSVEWDSKQTILHEKSVRIDGRILILGSHNWTSPSLLENRELSLLVQGPAPLLDAGAFARSLLRDIEKAQKEATLASFEIDESSNPYDFGSKLASALIRAKKRGLKVRLLLDASQLRVPETGEILYQYRGLRKAEELARSGVHVYYDTTAGLFHAKVALVDSRIVYVGSQNLEMRKDVMALEATARVDSPRLADQVKTYLAAVLRDSFAFHHRQTGLEGIRLPFAFLEKKGAFSRMFTNQAEETFRLYAALLREAWQSGSHEVQRKWPPSLQDDRRRLVREYRVLGRKRRRANRPARVWLADPATGAPFFFPEKDFFVVPESFFEFGWLERLQHGEIFLFWIHLAESQRSSQSPFWSLPQREIVRRFGINRSNLTSATIALERWNLIEVIRDPHIVLRNVFKRPNRYRVNPPGSLEEFELAKRKMIEELSMTRKDLEEAERLASLLNEGHDPAVLRKFLFLIDRYGISEVRRAARITARFKPHFALRNVHHTAAILRNWSAGIYK